MSIMFTEAFRIGTAGTSSAGFALHNPNTTTQTAVVVPFRNTVAGATVDVALQAGQILPLKFREVRSASANLTGLL